MAASPFNLKAPCHARSISLPSAPHPLIPEFNEHLTRLGASEAASASISHRLNGLKDLHDCVDNLLLLPLTQQTLIQHSDEKWVDELLDGSLRLLDFFSTAKDALLQTREHAHELQSSIRRKRGGENGISSEVVGYLTTRKKVKKVIHKALKDLKGVEKKCSFSPLNKDPETETVSMLREAETVTLKVLESLLSSIAGETAYSKPIGWSLLYLGSSSLSSIDCLYEPATCKEQIGGPAVVCRSASPMAKSVLISENPFVFRVFEMRTFFAEEVPLYILHIRGLSFRLLWEEDHVDSVVGFLPSYLGREILISRKVSVNRGITSISHRGGSSYYGKRIVRGRWRSWVNFWLVGKRVEREHRFSRFSSSEN